MNKLLENTENWPLPEKVYAAPFTNEYYRRVRLVLAGADPEMFKPVERDELELRYEDGSVPAMDCDN